MYAVRNDKASAAQAAIQFQQVVKLEPDNFITWVNLGNAYMTLGKNAFAAEAYQQALNASQSSLEQGPYGGSTGNPGENGGVWQAGDPCQTLIMYINNAIALRNSPF